MKIKAKEVKVGMTIGWGVITLKVKDIKKGVQKNGKETRTFIGNAVRSMGKGNKDKSFSNYDFTAKSETLLILK